MSRITAAERKRIVHEWLDARRGKVKLDALEAIKRRGLRKSAHYAKYRSKNK